MIPFTLTVHDRNVSHTLATTNTGAQHPDHASKAISFPTNIRYVFEDDEDFVAEEDADIENILIVEVDPNLKVTQVELISDEYQLLSFESQADNELELDVLSRFCTLETESQDLDELMQIYKTQNEQLNSIFNAL
ncbi:LAMI_0C06018g1_1 [Lachancea mirantina]|uniref:LAMI_0C06018g1_1 n=1 Tax=Lachancea mirantina TaxID=1230905 RepID=A0A1G4J3B2_9SACH|nr:LAMI_0C06018g1_1 [Lachancea mirantina]